MLIGAACGPAAAPAGRQRGAACDPDRLELCERKLLAAVARVDVPRELVSAYVAARRAHDDDDGWARLWQQMTAPGPAPAVVVLEEAQFDDPLRRALTRASEVLDAAVSEARSASGDAPPLPPARARTQATVRTLVVDRLPAAKAIGADDLLIALGEAAGAAHVVHLRGGRTLEVTHLFPDDPVAAFVPTVRPALRETSVTQLAEDLVLAALVRAAFAEAAGSRYLQAAAIADVLARRTAARATGSSPGAPLDPLRPSAVRARFAMEVLSGAGLVLEPVSAERLEDSVDHPPPSAQGTAYEDWLRVRTARDERAEWARRRDRILAGVPADRRAEIDALEPRAGDCSGASRPPPAIASVHDLLLSSRLTGALLPRGLGDTVAPAQLTFAAWLPRFQALVATIERTHTAWAHVPILLSQRAEVMGQTPAALSIHRRVTDLALAHATALRALERAEPVRYRALSHLPLVYSPGVLGDERLRTAVVELTQATVQDKLARAADAAAVFDGLLAGFFAGMSYPPAIQAEHFVALQGAFTAKLRGDLTRDRGWPVAGLYALDAAVRLLGDRAQASRTLGVSADQIARALAGNDVAHRELAALATSLARYAALALEGKLDARREDPAAFPADRRAARTALEAAVRSLAGPEDRPPKSVVDDLTALADGLVAAIATHFTERAKVTEGKGPVCARDTRLGPVVTRAVARLGDVRRRILLHPRFERDGGAWGRRSRLLVTVLSDALDLLAARGPQRAEGARRGKRELTVSPAAAEARLREGLSDWNEHAGAAAVAQAYLLLRELSVADSGQQFVAQSGGRIRAVLEGARLFFGEGPDGARVALLEALSGMPDRAPGAGEEILVAYARSLFERGQRDQGDLLLMATMGAAALTRTAPSRASVELAGSTGSRVGWALRFLAELAAGRRGVAPDPAAYAAAMRSVRDDGCGAADPEDVLTAMTAVRSFASGSRADARAALDTLLDKAEQRGLAVPKITYRYEEKTETKVLALSLDVSYGAGFLEGSNSLQLGLGIRSRGEPEGKMTTAFAPTAAAEAGEESARTYVHLAALAAAYHYLDGDPSKGAGAAARAVAVLSSAGVRLGARAVVSPSAAGWAADSRALLAVDAQLAAEAGQPFLAGDLWTVLRASLDPDSDDAAISAVLDDVPIGLSAVAEAKPVLDRARRALRMVAAPLPCTDAKVELGGYEEAGCDGYPLALSLRIADALKRLPRLRRAGPDTARCADLRALDAFLEGVERRTYDPDAFTRAVQALAAEGKGYEAAVLLARQRNEAHCSPTLGGAARTLASGNGLPASLRADLLSVAVNCSASSVDDRLIADVLALDAATRALADPTRNFKLLLFSTDLAHRARRWDLLAKLAAQPDFVTRWLDGSPAAGTAALLVDHAAAVLGEKPIDLERTKNAYQLLCQTFAPGDRAELCADVEALRKGGADTRARAEAALARLITAATSPPKSKTP